MGTVSEQLGMTAFSREDFVRLLEFVLERQPPRRLIIGKSTPPPPRQENMEVYPKFVFDIPVSGVKHLICGNGSDLCEYHLSPGEILLTPPGVWKLPVWDSAHELFCLVFTREFLRCTYVDHSRPTGSGKRPVCTHFHHTCAAPNPLLEHLLNALALLPEEGEEASGAGVRIVPALLELTRKFLANDHPCASGKAERTYRRIRQYLHENFSLPLTREQTAEEFRLNPAYLSRLFRLQSGRTFSETLKTIRMEHAAYLLRHTELLIDEITLLCGYRSTPFFTEVFRLFYGLPPGEFRLKSKSPGKAPLRETVR